MKNKIKILALLVLMLSINASQKTDSDYFEITKNLKLMASVYEKLNDFYVDIVFLGFSTNKGIQNDNNQQKYLLHYLYQK